MPDYVFILRHPKGLWKVGCSIDPRRRCSQLSRAYKAKMVLHRIWDWEFAGSVEMIAHAALSQYRVAGYREVYSAPLAIVLAAVEEAVEYMDLRRQKMWKEGRKLKLEVAA